MPRSAPCSFGEASQWSLCLFNIVRSPPIPLLVLSYSHQRERIYAGGGCDYFGGPSNRGTSRSDGQLLVDSDWDFLHIFRLRWIAYLGMSIRLEIRVGG